MVKLLLVASAVLYIKRKNENFKFQEWRQHACNWSRNMEGPWNGIKNAIKAAIKAGYRHIDTAAIYENEEAIGEALNDLFNSGEIIREDLFITSKLWNDSHKEEQVMPALAESLKRLQLDYLDLHLIHWPIAFKYGVNFPKTPSDYYSPQEVPLTETWRQMEVARKTGYTRHIGVSNFSKSKLEHLIKNAETVPEMNQVELHPYLQQPELLDFCRDRNIHLTAYAPLGSADRSSKIKGDDEPSLMDIETIRNIAKKHNATAAQILISWHTHRGCAVIPKSTSEDHIVANFKAADINLDDEDMKNIAKLDRNYRFITGKFFEEPAKGYVDIYS